MSCEVLQQLSQVTPAPEHLQLHIVVEEFVGVATTDGIVHGMRI